ncbi:putative transporter small subunit [Brevundimonas sp.]|nr:putative transporter small subunit [Brevundimonas sp.]
MGTLGLTAYILVWPALVAVVLIILVKAFLSDWITARREGRRII